MKKLIFIVILIVSLGGMSWYVYPTEFLLQLRRLIVIQFFLLIPAVRLIKTFLTAWKTD